MMHSYVYRDLDSVNQVEPYFNVLYNIFQYDKEKAMRGLKRGQSEATIRFLILFSALVLLFFIPYTGNNPFGTAKISILIIPVFTASVMLGSLAGMLMGLLWCVLYIVRIYLDSEAAVTFSSVLMCLPVIVCGAVPGWIRRVLKKTHLRNAFRASLSAGVGSVLYAFLLFVTNRVNNASGIPEIGSFFWIKSLIELIAAVVAVPLFVKLFRRYETVIGIDMDGSSTKIVLLRKGKCVRTLHIEKGADIEEAVEQIGTDSVRRIALTGVGAAGLIGDIAGIPTSHVEEFASLANGAAFCSGRNNVLCVSIGTGTSFIRVTPFEYRHFGGSGMGGGTLKSLSGGLCDTLDMDQFRCMAVLGDLSKVDLQLKDICEGDVPDLLPTTTVSNLGKTGTEASPEDMAAGICNLIFESIGVMAAFSVKSCLTRTIVMTGTITEWQIAKRSLDEVSSLHHVSFIVPDYSRYAGAIGAALTE